MTVDKEKPIGFFKKNISYIIILGLLCTIGIKSNIVLGLAVVILALVMLFSSTENAFYWSLFLVPNIRIFDSLGTTVVANVLMAMPVIPYIFRSRYGISTKVLSYGCFLCALGLFHSIGFSEQVLPTISWVLVFILCYGVTTDKRINPDSDMAISAMVSGIIFSSAVYLINNPWFVSDLSNKLFVYRFEAYGSDPNYFSLYLCLCFSAIVVRKKLKRNDYITLIILMIIGLMTASKMCLILLVLNIFCLFFYISNISVNRLLTNVLFIAAIFILAFYYKDVVLAFVDNIVKRLGGKNITMSSLTTGRSDILSIYSYVLLNDSNTLLVGNGFSYELLFGGKIAHNTYLDIVLSWGFLGGSAFVYIIVKWIKQYKEKLNAKKFTAISKFPFVILLIGFMALSCFSAQMFFFVIAFSMLQLSDSTKYSNFKNTKVNQEGYHGGIS